MSQQTRPGPQLQWKWQGSLTLWGRMQVPATLATNGVTSQASPGSQVESRSKSNTHASPSLPRGRQRLVVQTSSGAHSALEVHALFSAFSRRQRSSDESTV